MFLYNIIFSCLFFAEPTKILLIGDSYLYSSNVDSLLSQTARFNQKNVEITSVLFPGTSIQRHLDSGIRNSKDPRTGKIYPENPAINYLKNYKWDYVVPVQRIRKWIGEETKLILLVPAIQGYNNFKNR